MAFTTTMLAWSILEFGNHMGFELQHATEAVKWGTDYFLKATSVPGKVVAQVGEPYSDHNCWERPEDMDTARTSYVLNTTNRGSEVSAEIAAALAASSMVFKNVDNRYSQVLLKRASQVFQFADQHRLSYNESVGPAVCPFYCDFSGFMNDPIYEGGSFAEFGWDSKHAGVNVLLSRVLADEHSKFQQPFFQYADKYVCSVLPESPSNSVSFSPGGLLFKEGGSNTQHTTAASFLLLVYSLYLTRSNNRAIHCGNNVVVTPSRLVQFAKGQVDYLLGSNPIKMSYMVGYGRNFPRKIHHRGSTLPSIDKRRRQIKCHDGDVFFYSKYPNPNQLTGAIVGGPDINDQYNDTRIDFRWSGPTTYINAPFVGVLAFFKEKGKGRRYMTRNSRTRIE
ncbi:hypothetical protein LWI29_024040 [Acer saccharum]|uniref:Endoglucanase n=1 Tax=Acer saccharum TaxID=4024 RepID=A0AA39SNI5_ACESA|nr:hypothetical protein LWI29_024040 [Acer saccharum]